jgi:hypothetical protein
MLRYSKRKGKGEILRIQRENAERIEDERLRKAQEERVEKYAPRLSEEGRKAIDQACGQFLPLWK